MPNLNLINCNTPSFIKKPVIGGRPARFIIKIGRFNVVILLITIKIGAEAVVYRTKYLQALTRGADITQLMCIRPEKNINTKMFLDPTPQLAATAILKIKTPFIKNLGVMVSIRNTGATFCQVRKKNELILDRFEMRAAPQK